MIYISSLYFYMLSFILASVYYIVFFLLAGVLISVVLTKRLAGKSIFDISYLVSSGTLNLNSLS